MYRMLVVAGIVLLADSAFAGNFQGQGRGLRGEAVSNVTVIALRADGGVLFRRTFANGQFVIPINDAALFADNKAITLLFSAPGRDDARIDNLLGTTRVANLDIILPLKFSAPPPQQKARRRCCLFRRR